MKKYILLLLLVFGLLGVSSAQLLDWSVANQTESEAFIASMPANFGQVGTLVSGQYGGVYGIALDAGEGLTYTPGGLIVGATYEMVANIMIQNLANTYINQQVWLAPATPAVPGSLQGTGTAGSYVTYTQSVTITDANQTFGIVRAAGSQVFVNGWTITNTTPSSETDIVTFEFPEQTGAATINATNHTVDIQVLFSTDFNNLTPTITLSEDASIIAGTLSGNTGSFPVSPGSTTYTVKAEDGTIQDWTVTVSRAAASSAKDILTFTHPFQSGVTTIGTNTVSLKVDPLADLTSLVPDITLSGGATISPLSGFGQDFSGGAVAYTVTAENGTTKIYNVTITTDNTVNTTPCSVKVP